MHPNWIEQDNPSEDNARWREAHADIGDGYQARVWFDGLWYHGVIVSPDGARLRYELDNIRDFEDALRTFSREYLS